MTNSGELVTILTAIALTLQIARQVIPVGHDVLLKLADGWNNRRQPIVVQSIMERRVRSGCKSNRRQPDPNVDCSRASDSPIHMAAS